MDEAPTLRDVKGIGKKYEDQLRSAGIRSIDDLANANPEVLTHSSTVPPARIVEWIDAAQRLRPKTAEHDHSAPDPDQLSSVFVVRVTKSPGDQLLRVSIHDVRTSESKRWTTWDPDEVARFVTERAGLEKSKKTKRKAGASLLPPPPSEITHVPAATPIDLGHVVLDRPKTLDIALAPRGVDMNDVPTTTVTARLQAHRLGDAATEFTRTARGSVTPSHGVVLHFKRIDVPPGIYRMNVTLTAEPATVGFEKPEMRLAAVS